MPDRKKTIDRLLMIADREQEWMENVGVPDASTIGPFLREVADMLKEQEPVPPDTAGAPWWRCGNCGWYIVTEQFRFCPWCGREVKWDG